MGIADIFSTIGKALRPMPKGPAKPGGGSPSAQAGIRPAVPKAGVPGTKNAFDINMYFKAVKLFFDDFFKKKVPMFFKNPGPYLKSAPGWFKKLPQDEQISYGVLGLGHVLVIVGIVLFIVL